MRVFLTLCSLMVVAVAKPQYNYGSGVSGTFGGSSGGSVGGGFGGGSTSGQFGGAAVKFAGGNSGFSSGGSSFGGSNFGAGGNSGFSSGGSSFGGSNFGAGSIGGGSSSSFGSGSGIGGASSFGGASNYQGGSASHGGQFEAPLVHKQFITVAAPEDNDSLSQTKHLVLGRPQKNYRVVFIKAPSGSSSNVKLSAEYAPQEEKTVIYVLSKKDNSLEVNDIATPAPTVPSKPEVFFIKYKTEEEAQHAQRQIQAEYDKIEGSSEHTDAGVAPQQSVVGILDGNTGGIGAGVGGAVGSGSFGTSASGSFGTGVGSSGSVGTSFTSGGSSSSFGTSDSVGVKSAAYLPPAGH